MHSIITNGFGASWTINAYNTVFLIFALVLHGRPMSFLRACREGVRSAWGIIIQFPLYAGIAGMMTNSGLVTEFSNMMISISTPATFPVVTFLSAGIVNFFIPSGGGQWAVQGPIFIEAARVLGTDPSRIVMAVAYGDQWTNMIQPFWTIPLLAIAGLPMRRIMGYTFVIFIVTFFTFAGGILLAGPG